MALFETPAEDYESTNPVPTPSDSTRGTMNPSMAVSMTPEQLFQLMQTYLNQPARPKPMLPDVTPFDGEDNALYPQFESSLRAKLTVDAAIFDSERAKVWYCFSRLNGKAAARINPWVEQYSQPGHETDFTVERIITHMKSAFGDTARKDKATQQLQRLQQKNRPYDELQAELERLLLEAGGYNWDDSLKINLLRGALNWEMQDKIIGVTRTGSYEEFKDTVKQIADQLEARKQRQKSFVKGASHKTSKPSTPQLDAMDWQPTPSAVKDGQRKHAKWVSRKEREQRMRDKRCLRCGASGHFVDGCPYLSPLPSHRVGNTKIYEPELEDTVAEAARSESDDSGKA